MASSNNSNVPLSSSLVEVLSENRDINLWLKLGDLASRAGFIQASGELVGIPDSEITLKSSEVLTILKALDSLLLFVYDIDERLEELE